jgi:hypothetical protein
MVKTAPVCEKHLVYVEDMFTGSDDAAYATCVHCKELVMVVDSDGNDVSDVETTDTGAPSVAELVGYTGK